MAALAFPVHAQHSMFADFKARGAGDVITIILAERTAAQRESGWANKADARIGGTASLSAGSGLSGAFAADARFNKSALHENESVQSDLLSGTMTATIVRRDEAGNLHVQGERRLSVNGETHIMRVSGLVRPYDVRTDNTVLSYQIANAAIEYHREGGITRSLFKPGRMVRLGLLAVLAGAVVYATQ
ncbi:flagellar basal body L-ring protein FlgH [Rhodocaloribacter litoris]|nr:flagellar basal body L-ring protein FlgH [Rhodocaloribacter litoris]